MPHYRLNTVLLSLTENLDKTEKLAAAAQMWINSTKKGTPKFTIHHRDMVIEIAFFRAFLSWEAFIEETFILYLLGKKPPKGKGLNSPVVATTRKAAGIIIEGDRNYVDWVKTESVMKRAGKIFGDSEPYFSQLKTKRSMFNELIILRNAIAHASLRSQEEFKNLSRTKLAGSYSPGITIGGFLGHTVPGSTPPQSFLEEYLDGLRIVSTLIIP
jgi:hypothetical protein